MPRSPNFYLFSSTPPTHASAPSARLLATMGAVTSMSGMATDSEQKWIEKMNDTVNKRSVEVQTAACEALAAMAGSRYSGKESRARIGELGGVESVMETMRSFPDNEVVLRAGCRAMWKLAYDADNSERMRIGKGEELLKKTLKEFHDDDFIVEDATKALQTIKDMGSWVSGLVVECVLLEGVAHPSLTPLQAPRAPGDKGRSRRRRSCSCRRGHARASSQARCARGWRRDTAQAGSR